MPLPTCRNCGVISIQAGLSWSRGLCLICRDREDGKAEEVETVVGISEIVIRKRRSTRLSDEVQPGPYRDWLLSRGK